MVVMASFASFGGGLPEDLFASPLNPPDVPDAVAAALPDLAEPKIESKLSDRAFVRYAVPKEGDDWHLTTVPPLNPDLRRHAFVQKKPERAGSPAGFQNAEPQVGVGCAGGAV